MEDTAVQKHIREQLPYTQLRDDLLPGPTPNSDAIVGTSRETTYMTTFAMIRPLITGVHGPGPNEYASVDEEG